MFPELCAMINTGSRKGVTSGITDKECWFIPIYTARVQLTLNRVSLCCYGALSMTDRWVCGRKVRGALEVAVELWERRGGWLGGCEHRSDSRSHRAIHTNGLMHRKICSSVDSVLTRMHLHTQHKSAEVANHFPCFLSARGEFVLAHLDVHWGIHTHTGVEPQRAPDYRTAGHGHHSRAVTHADIGAVVSHNRGDMLRQTPGSLQTRVVGGRGLTSKIGTRKRCTWSEQQQDVVVVGEVVVERGGGEVAGEGGRPQRSMRKADARVTIGGKAGRGRVVFFIIYMKKT